MVMLVADKVAARLGYVYRKRRHTLDDGIPCILAQCLVFGCKYGHVWSAGIQDNVAIVPPLVQDMLQLLRTLSTTRVTTDDATLT